MRNTQLLNEVCSSACSCEPILGWTCSFCKDTLPRLRRVLGTDSVSGRTVNRGLKMNKLRCKKHPKYQAKRVPRAKCADCMKMWLNSPHRPKGDARAVAEANRQGGSDF